MQTQKLLLQSHVILLGFSPLTEILFASTINFRLLPVCHFTNTIKLRDECSYTMWATVPLTPVQVIFKERLQVYTVCQLSKIAKSFLFCITYVGYHVLWSDHVIMGGFIFLNIVYHFFIWFSYLLCAVSLTQNYLMGMLRFDNTSMTGRYQLPSPSIRSFRCPSILCYTSTPQC